MPYVNKFWKRQNDWRVRKKKKVKIVWKIGEKCLSLQRQNIRCDYAAECGE